jgi:hypothetical protein
MGCDGLVRGRPLISGSGVRAFEAIYGERTEEHLSEIAHHYGRSGNVPKAVDYLKRAAEQASERSAIEEADRQISRCDSAFEALARGAGS